MSDVRIKKSHLNDDYEYFFANYHHQLLRRQFLEQNPSTEQEGLTLNYRKAKCD